MHYLVASVNFRKNGYIVIIFLVFFLVTAGILSMLLLALYRGLRPLKVGRVQQDFDVSDNKVRHFVKYIYFFSRHYMCVL